MEEGQDGNLDRVSYWLTSKLRQLQWISKQNEEEVKEEEKEIEDSSSRYLRQNRGKSKRETEITTPEKRRLTVSRRSPHKTDNDADKQARQQNQ